MNKITYYIWNSSREILKEEYEYWIRVIEVRPDEHKVINHYYSGDSKEFQCDYDRGPDYDRSPSWVEITEQEAFLELL